MKRNWKLGDYTFTINPNGYSEQIEVVGDNAVTLDGTIISQPTLTKETYDIKSVFFQYRPRILSDIYIAKASGIEFVNNLLYVLNKEDSVVDVYSKNLASKKKSITLPPEIPIDSITSFDVDKNEKVVLADTNNVYTLVSGVVSTVSVNNILGDISGLKLIGSYIWIVTSSFYLYKLSPSDMTVINFLRLPDISYMSYGYNGLTYYDSYIIIPFTGNDSSGVYYVDISNGAIVNNFELPYKFDINDIAYNGDEFLFLSSDKTVKISTKNTVLSDLYELEMQIKGRGYLDLIDDMDVRSRVMVNDYSISRDETSLKKYTVNLSVTRIDRG